MKFSFTSLVIYTSCLFEAAGLVLQTLATHLPETTYMDAHHGSILRIAASILMFNSLGAIALAIVLNMPTIWHRPRLLKTAISLLLLGVFIFSLSLTCIAFGVVPNTPAAPIGGGIQILSWILAAFCFLM